MASGVYATAALARGADARDRLATLDGHEALVVDPPAGRHHRHRLAGAGRARAIGWPGR
ncbi:hypothetical protein V6U89_29735 [Micromonospora sp. CPCC 206171]|uniref:hypothetical protein n=1 Tax=Micromonospora sp. CPCC 206171 TaxID=3122405 RepID=UPI002FF35163